MVVTLGVDVHKDTHTTAAVDQVGRAGGERVVRATDAGHRQLIGWARHEFPGERRWAIEDCRHVSGRLERALLTAGEQVVRVPPKLMAGARASARTRGKSDPIDALAIARAALREPDLPIAAHDQTTRELKHLVDHREALVTERTRWQNRVRWHLHDLDPELDIPTGSLDRAVVLDRLTAWITTQPATATTQIVAEQLDLIRDLNAKITTAHREITARVTPIAPRLLSLAGVGDLTAAKIIAETATITRFRSEACYAMHTGTAPIEVSSGRTDRHRLARGGNRQLNAALHRIAITQIRLPDHPGQLYYQRRRAQGDNTKEALRALKRRLARTVFTLLKADAQHHLPATA